MNIRKNDTIQIIAGKDKGKQGKVSRVLPKKGKILVQGLNMFRKNKRPTKQNEKGEIISIPRPFDVSNAMIVCGSCGKPVRVGHKQEGEIKVRYCKRCQAAI